VIETQVRILQQERGQGDQDSSDFGGRQRVPEEDVTLTYSQLKSKSERDSKELLKLRERVNKLTKHVDDKRINYMETEKAKETVEAENKKLKLELEKGADEILAKSIAVS